MVVPDEPRAGTRLLLADDHALFRAGLRRLLEEDGRSVVAEAGDGESAVALALEHVPDVVLMDLGMPKLGGIEATRRIVAARRGIRVLIVTRQSGEGPVEEALRAGADGYLLKLAPPADLLRAVDALCHGSAFFSPEIARSIGRLADGSTRASPGAGQLSPREREVVTQLAEGLSSREIAALLHVSPRTVDTHRVRIMKKLGIHKTPQLVRFAIRTGLVEA